MANSVISKGKFVETSFSLINNLTSRATIHRNRCISGNAIVCGVLSFVTTAEIPAWTHLLYVPSGEYDLFFFDTTMTYRFQVHETGYIQNTVAIPSGTAIVLQIIC